MQHKKEKKNSISLIYNDDAVGFINHANAQQSNEDQLSLSQEVNHGVAPINLVIF